MSQMPPEHRKQPKHLDTKQRQTKNMRRARQSASQNRGGHECCVGAQRSREAGGGEAVAVVVEEDVED